MSRSKTLFGKALFMLYEQKVDTVTARATVRNKHLSHYAALIYQSESTQTEVPADRLKEVISLFSDNKSDAEYLLEWALKTFAVTLPRDTLRPEITKHLIKEIFDEPS